MFVLYVEGPRDRDVLLAWAWRVNAGLRRALDEGAVILGGRRPERAVAHFRELRARDAAARGLCVLDRDGTAEEAAPAGPPAGLDFHVWRRRHIESYLLVPEAIRRSLQLPAHDARVARALRRLAPASEDERALRDLDAKRLLAPDGELARSLGLPVSPGRIARSMRADELAPEIHGLLGRAVAAWRRDW
jgi:hypothetical protein